jgi:hypothetical protein
MPLTDSGFTPPSATCSTPTQAPLQGTHELATRSQRFPHNQTSCTTPAGLPHRLPVTLTRCTQTAHGDGTPRRCCSAAAAVATAMALSRDCPRTAHSPLSLLPFLRRCHGRYRLQWAAPGPPTDCQRTADVSAPFKDAWRVYAKLTTPLSGVASP